MKSIGVFVTVLLLFCHDGSKILHNGVGSSQSQSHRTWTPSTAPCTKLQNFNVPHGPDTLVDWNWTFQENWLQPSYVLDVAFAFFLACVICSCTVLVVTMLTFVGLSTVISRIQPSPLSSKPGIASYYT